MAESPPKINPENKPPGAENQLPAAETILPRVIEEEMKVAYVNYAMSVIVGRALPDVRDGLKPVHRRILYTMSEIGLLHNKAFKKSARIVGECFVPGTLILTDKGLVPIESIEKEDVIYTQTGKDSVKELYEMPKRKLLRVTTSNGLSTVVTPSQKFKVINPTLQFEWKEAQNLSSNDYIIAKADYPPVQHLSSLGIFKGQEVKLNKNIAYLLGQLVSDGWVDKDKKRGYSRCGFCSSSYPVIQKVFSILQQEFSYTATIEEKHQEVDCGELKLLKKLFTVRIQERELNRFIISTFSLQAAVAKNKQVPLQILTSPKEVIYSFLSGLIDGDGSVHKERNTIHYGSISEKLIEVLQIMLQHLGIFSHKYVDQNLRNHEFLGKAIKKNNPFYSLEINGSFASLLAKGLCLAEENKVERSRRIVENTSEINPNVFEVIPYSGKIIFNELSRRHLGGGWYQEEDGQKFRAGVKYRTGGKIRYAKDLPEKNLGRTQILNWGIADKLRRINSPYAPILQEIIAQNLFFLKVEKVEKAGAQKTYDLEIEKVPEFVANGLMAHNCLGKYHPHGDTAVYDALVRMAQDFSLRYPLIKGQGNFGCFTGDTKVALTDGRELSFLELVEEHKQGKKNYTYTINSQGKVEIAEIKNPRLTKRDQQIIRVVLDSGAEIKCTLNHRFMLRAGGYTEAQNLKTGDSLFPLYLRLSTAHDGIKPSLVGYQLVLHPKINEWVPVHVLADNWNIQQGLYAKNEGKIRHHLNFNKLNNNPDNICRLPWAEHWRIHAEHASALHENPWYREKIARGRKEFWSKEENKVQASQRLSQRNKQNWQNPAYQERMRKNLSEVNLNFFRHHPEARIKQSQRLKNFWEKPAYQQKMSSLKSKEMRQRWEEKDPTLRRFTSEESRQIWSNPKHREYISQKSKAMWEDEGYKQKMSRQAALQWQNEEYRSKFPLDHFRAMAKILWENQEMRELHRDKAKKQWQNDNFRKKIIQDVQKRNRQRLAERPDFMKQLATKAAESLTQKWKDPSYKKRIIKHKIARYVHFLIKTHSTVTPEIYQKNRSKNWIPKLEKALGYFDDFSDLLEQAKTYNHSVAGVEILSGTEEVYDLTIERTHNFALAAGVFVHNSIDGDNAAAMRYTEAKLAKFAEELLQDLEKNTVDFRDNFDGSLKEPEVLPSKVPNLLVNGSSGIAVGMATNIPPHNLKEICSAIITLIDTPEITIEELLQIIPAPDFPTGAEIVCGNGLRNAYTWGKGKVTIKAVSALEGHKIIINEIPYQVNKAELIEQIAELVKDKRIQGIKDINDESDREGIRIVIELSKDADAQVVLNQLYQYSNLQVSFGIQLLTLVNNQPKTIGLKELLQHHIKHRQNVITRRTQYDLQQAQEKVHILAGLLVALQNIDAVIPGIKASRTVEDARIFLMSSYNLSEIQAKAILEMRLQKLASLEQQKIRDEHQDLLVQIAQFQEILASGQKVLNLIKDELRGLQEEYGDERRSKITYGTDDEEFIMEELVPEENVVVTMTHAGYIKRLPADTYKTQRRGGKGIIATGVKEEDFVEKLYIASTHDYLLFFTDQGQVYWLKVYQIPEAGRQAKGKHIANLLEMASGEKITAIVPVRNFTEGYLFMATRQGTAKKTELQEFANPRKGGIRAITLDEGDSLVGVQYTDGKREIILATREGAANRFKEEAVNAIGRQGRGVRGIRLEESDEVIGMLAAEEGKDILTLTVKGYGKRTPVSEYRLCNRGGKGVTNIKITDKNGPVKAVMLVEGKEELVLISKQGVAIRIKCADISQIGRATQGVRVMKLEENDQLAAAAMMEGEGESVDNN